MRNITTTVLSAITLTALLGACGGSDKAATSTSTSTTSSSTTSTTSSATSSVATSSAPAPGSTVDAKTFTSTIRDAVKQAKSYHVLDTKSSYPGPMTGRIVNHGEGKADFESVSPADGTMRYVDGDAYFASPDAPNRWIKFSKTSSDPEVKSTLASMAADASEGGYSELRVYEAGKVTFVGEESEGQHYRIVAPADKFYDEAIDESAVTAQGGPVNTSADKAKLAGKTVTYDLWVNAKSLPVKVKFDSTSLTGITFSANPAEVIYRSTTLLTKWGEPVTIEVPAAAQTVDYESVGDGSAAA